MFQNLRDKHYSSTTTISNDLSGTERAYDENGRIGRIMDVKTAAVYNVASNVQKAAIQANNAPNTKYFTFVKKRLIDVSSKVTLFQRFKEKLLTLPPKTSWMFGYVSKEPILVPVV